MWLCRVVRKLFYMYLFSNTIHRAECRELLQPVQSLIELIIRAADGGLEHGDTKSVICRGDPLWSPWQVALDQVQAAVAKLFTLRVVLCSPGPDQGYLSTW